MFCRKLAVLLQICTVLKINACGNGCQSRCLKFQSNFIEICSNNIVLGVSHWLQVNINDHVMGWYHQATCRFLNQCSQTSVTPYSITGPQWVDKQRGHHRYNQPWEGTLTEHCTWISEKKKQELEISVAYWYRKSISIIELFVSIISIYIKFLATNF